MRFPRLKLTPTGFRALPAQVRREINKQWRKTHSRRLWIALGLHWTVFFSGWGLAVCQPFDWLDLNFVLAIILIVISYPIMIVTSVATVRSFLPDEIKRRGYCVACGYNLCGNTSGVCPECGQAI